MTDVVHVLTTDLLRPDQPRAVDPEAAKQETRDGRHRFHSMLPQRTETPG
jgi:hypothetical protein